MPREDVFATLPGPAPLPGLGWRGPQWSFAFAFDGLAAGLKLREKYGDFFTLTSMGQPILVGFSPEYNRQIFTNPGLFYNADRSDFTFKIPENTPAYRITGGLNLINGEKHKRLRRLMQPAFQRTRVEGYRELMVAQTLNLLQNWAVGEVRPMLTEMRRLTMAIACATFLGLSHQEFARIDALRRLIADNPFNNPLTSLLPFDLPTLPYHKMLTESAEAETTLLRIIAERKAQGGAGQDVISALLEAVDEDGSRLDDYEIATQIFTLFGAGHETTASALSWTLFLLAAHPAIARELYDELCGELHGEPPTIEQLERLPLLEGVIRESLRLFPPFLLGLRTATAPVEFMDYQLPAGTKFTYHPALTHRLPELYSDPNRFLPRRWDSINPSPYEFIPFAGGPRMCLGAFFAQTEMKLVLATLLQRFQPALPLKAEVNRGGFILSAPRGGLPMRLQPAGTRLLAPDVRGNVSLAVTLA